VVVLFQLIFHDQFLLSQFNLLYGHFFLFFSSLIFKGLFFFQKIFLINFFHKNFKLIQQQFQKSQLFQQTFIYYFWLSIIGFPVIELKILINLLNQIC